VIETVVDLSAQTYRAYRFALESGRNDLADALREIGVELARLISVLARERWAKSKAGAGGGS